MFFESERLLFRQWQELDRDVFYELNSDSTVMKFFPKPLTRDESDDLIDRTIDIISKSGWGWFAVELKDSKQFIGFIGLAVPLYETHFTPCMEIGWRLHQNFWKKGFATEGAKAVLRFAFENLGKEEIVSFTSKLNLPSVAVMERIGMKRDFGGDFDHPRVEPGHPLRPHLLYRINSDDWKNGLSIYKDNQ
ncbi:MAG: GNAT family N-acetyltransferase, partial [Bdellovibrionales bacterium]|nr:GNAT family N-acetyltransferase [Bdellovibrionales bacterium]